MKQYNSFDELDKDLRILRLQKQIAFAEVKKQALEVKENITRGRFFIKIFSKAWHIPGSMKHKLLGIGSGILLKQMLRKRK